MTGFGRAVHEEPAGSASPTTRRFEVEVRTVNHRTLKVVTRLPERLQTLTTDVESLAKERLARGTVYVTVDLRSAEPAYAYRLNRAVLLRYVADLEAARRDCDLAGIAPLALERVALLPGAIESAPAVEDDPAALRGRLLEVCGRAIDALDEMRRVEGEALAADIKTRRSAIEVFLANVKTRIPSSLMEYRARLTERIQMLLKGTGTAPAEADLLREVAHFADRTDISEEAARLESHLKQLDAALGEAGPVGRKLDFLAQEMLREANTMGAKTQDSALVKDVLAIKLEVDKIREQVQNVE
jgi:uncharacterized protein (TIGR00255 family)